MEQIREKPRKPRFFRMHLFWLHKLVEHRGFEPLTPTLPVLCAPNCANAPCVIIIPYLPGGVNSFFAFFNQKAPTKPPELFGAGDKTWTYDLLITNQLHYRLCYTSIAATWLLYRIPDDLSIFFWKKLIFYFSFQKTLTNLSFML